MTSVSQPPTIISQDVGSSIQSGAPVHAAGSAAAGRNNYASATRKSNSPAGAAANSAHGKSDSFSAPNGRNTIAPAVPTLGGPTIINGNNAVNSPTFPGEHGRKASFTISAAGTSGQMPNGGPVIGAPSAGSAIQFGSINSGASPAMSNSLPHLGHSSSSLGVSAISNPRITSPANSPSPIPQPTASGGRPPSSFHAQSNSLSFGSLGGGDDASRQRMPAGSLTPGLQAAHLRRESSQSSHNEMGMPGMVPNNGRGGFSQGGRGRGFVPQQQYPQHIGNSPNPSFRTLPPNAPRGGPNMAPQFTPVGRPPYSAGYPSPHQAARSPAIANAQPIHPQPGQMPMPAPQMAQVPYGYGPQMGHHNKQGQFMSPQYGVDPNYYNQYGMPPHMYMQNGYIGAPAAARPPYGVPQGNPQFMQSQYGQPQPMSRTSSAVSDRPSSTLSQPPQAPIAPVMGHQASVNRSSNATAQQSKTFQFPQKKSVGIVIKDPSSGAVKTFDKPPASPAHPPPIKTPTASAAPTPPPRTPSSQHIRADSKVARTAEQASAEMREQIKRKIQEDEERERKAKEAEEAKARKEREEIEAAAKAEEEKKAAEAAAKLEAEAAAKREAEATVKREAEATVKREAEAAAKREAEAAAKLKAEADAKSEAEAAEAAAKLKAEADAKSEAEASAAKAAAELKAKADAAAASTETVPQGTPSEAPKEQRTTVEQPKPAEPDLDDDEYWARIEAEEQEKELERERAYQKKKAIQKEENARKEAERAAKFDEELKKAEQEADAIERARLKRPAESEGNREKTDAFAALKGSEGAFKATETATETPPAADTPVSGAATPKSDTSSMGPPRSFGSIKQKPAALKLETQKPVEAPQASAALQSLRSARFLISISDRTYPEGTASPNPALNSAAPVGKFRYDKDFLLQFQKAFTDKPSETWNDKVKETVGDTSETPASARRTTTMGHRQPSNRLSAGPSAPFSGPLGSFQRAPPGSTSAERFAISNMSGGKPGPVGAMRYPPNAGSGFPGAFPMQRTASSTAVGPPQSPRNPSHRGSNRSKASKRENDKEDKSMPMTAGQSLKPIEVSAGGWKPTSIGRNAVAGPPPGGEDGYQAPDVVQKKVKAALNKMTPTTFLKISSQILDIVMQSKKETDGRTLRQVIQLTFVKATDEAHWAQMYAEFCSRMLQNMSPDIKDETMKDKNGNVPAGTTLFRKYLLNRCQQDFEQGWKSKLPDQPDGADSSKEAAMLSDEYYIAATAKRRGLGLVRFIGELYKLGMLTSRIMHMCVQKLVDVEGMPDEAEVESLTSLLKTIGENLDSEEKGRSAMNAYFERITTTMNLEGLPSRLRFMLMDIVDLRRKNWKVKNSASKGPATLEEVHAQAAEQQRAQEAQRAVDSARARGGGGGGRPGIGRGDVRNGAGQFGMPPPDYNRNTVGVDDLRRLQRSGSRQASTQGPTFGPTSMFNTRGSNKRTSLAPGSILGRGDESNRTAAPPGGKRDEKEAATSANAFSALAALDSSEANEALSPPSASSSPALAKRPLPDRTQSKSPLATGGASGA